MRDVVFYIAAVGIAAFVLGWHLRGRALAAMNDGDGRAAILAWAQSGGFAATHNAGASDDAIASDMLRYFRRYGVKIVRLSDGDWF